MPTLDYDDMYLDNYLDNVSETSIESNGDVYYKVQKRNKTKNKCKLENDTYIYGSRGIGTYIVDAVSGLKTPYKVGSFDENLFFSIVDSRANDFVQEPLFFYFYSPEQCERVFLDNKMSINISQKMYENWHKKYLLAKNRNINKH